MPKPALLKTLANIDHPLRAEREILFPQTDGILAGFAWMNNKNSAKKQSRRGASLLYRRRSYQHDGFTGQELYLTIYRTLGIRLRRLGGAFGRKAYQSQLDFGGSQIFLLRAIVDDTVDPPNVITAYRTRKISKYWRTT